MAESLPLRAARPVPRWLAVPVARPPGESFEAAGRLRIYLAPLHSRTDRRILLASLKAAQIPPPRWVPTRRRSVRSQILREAFLGGEPVLVPILAPMQGPDRLARLLRWATEAGQEVDLVPVEALWGPEGRSPSVWNVLLGNPYEPPELMRWLRVRLPGRVRVVLGAPGTLSALRRAAPTPDDYLALSAFIRGQAIKALSQGERQVFGDRYKIPHFVVEQILREAEFQDRAAAAGASLGLTHDESVRRAERALRELATGHNLFYMELFRRFARWLYTRVYERQIRVERRDLERLRELGRTAALVFVPSHKSNFDHLVMYSLLFSHGFPPPHTAAGINMAFFPMDRILRHTGAYFIRRSFQDDPVYKEALRAFIAYLVHRRFHQEFFIEGGRTRSGKLLPPRFGMLRYIVEGIRKAQVRDLYFVPTAITYTHVFEVQDYVREQLGGEKEKESFGFLVRMIRVLLQGSLRGSIHVRFAEPITLRGHLERAGDDRLVVEKLAFQISNQINAMTILTSLAVVCAVLLRAGRRALTLPELEGETARVLEFARERGIDVVPELAQGPHAGVEGGLETLRSLGLLDVYAEGIEPVYAVSERGRHIASFYRNTIIHFFLVRAITALAQRADEAPEGAERWALRLRELLKFEFFFAEREAFREQVRREICSMREEEQSSLPPLGVAGPRLLLDYLESYWVMTQTLQALTASQAPWPEAEVVTRCHAIGRQLLRQNRVSTPELLSSVNFRNALKLAVNLQAVELGPDGYLPGDPERLAALARDLEHLVRLARY